MAAKLGTSQIKGSDVVYDVCCSICEDDDIYKEGRFYCKKCSKYFCDSCVLTHNKFLKDHSVTEKDEGDNWPVNKIVDDTMELCVEHSTERLTMFCEDHEKLLCQLCLLHNHRQCSHIVLLADKIKSTGQCIDVAKIAKRIEELQERLEDVVKIGEQNMKSLQTSYEYVLDEILKLRRQISETFDRLQQETIRKLEQLHSSLKISLENESKQCVEFISKLKEYDIYCSENICSERSFIINKKCLDQAASADSFLRKQIKNAYIEFQHNKDLKQYLDSCTELGNITIHEAPQRNCVDPNSVVSVKDQSQFKVQSTTDGHVCFITGICEAFNGEIIIADANNQCVKLLDQAFNLIEQLQLPASPHFISKISPNELVVACGLRGYVRQIHFLRVDKGRIVKRNNIELEQDCHGMAFHQGDLFVTTSTVVWQLTMEGRLVKKLYEEKSRHFMGVGVSPDGKRIYVTDDDDRLLTLTRDGEVTVTLHDPAFRTNYYIPNIHVADTGQVFVCGAKTVNQVETDGKKVLNSITLDSSNPASVYVNEDTSKMIVGFFNNDNVVKFKTKVL